MVTGTGLAGAVARFSGRPNGSNARNSSFGQLLWVAKLAAAWSLVPRKYPRFAAASTLRGAEKRAMAWPLLIQSRSTVRAAIAVEIMVRPLPGSNHDG
jgi:hypothetical protein